MTSPSSKAIHGKAPKLHPHLVPGTSEVGLAMRAIFLLLLLTMAGLLAFFDNPWLSTLALVFVSIVLEALPFMLLGSMVSGFVEVFISKERLAAILPRRRVTLTFAAAGLGILFPVCECAIVPVVRRFLRKGVPLSAAVAYLLAGPIFNPVVGASTAVAYFSNPGWQTAWIVAIRMASGFGIAMGIGLVMGKLFPGSSALLEASEEAKAANGASCAHPNHDHAQGLGSGHGGPSLGNRLLSAINHGADDFLDVTQYLVMGAFIAGLLQTTVSRSAFIELAASPVFAIPLMLLLAFVLNLCSEADAFIAASFRGILPISAQMAFMVLGPMLDIKLVIMYLGVFRKRTIVVLALIVIAAVLLVMFLLHALMGEWYTLPTGLGGASAKGG